MFTTTANHKNSHLIRNYLILAISVMVVSAGVSDLFNNPARVAQQDRLDTYGRYVSAGLVSMAQKAGR